MGRLRSSAVAALAGALSWSWAEYGLHRFAMHQLRGRGLASVEHLKHHGDVTYFAPTSKKLLSAAGSAAVAWPLANAVTDRRWATAFTGGFLTTYFWYELVHRRLHTHPPVGAYGRWARRSHMHHHFGAPLRNLGVTSPVWDKVFGTYDDPGVVTVPRRMAPVWMLDERGEVRAGLIADYVVKGRSVGDLSQADRDQAAAFANLAPLS